jgi:hypothetical protein
MCHETVLGVTNGKSVNITRTVTNSHFVHKYLVKTWETDTETGNPAKGGSAEFFSDRSHTYSPDKTQSSALVVVKDSYTLFPHAKNTPQTLPAWTTVNPQREAETAETTTLRHSKRTWATTSSLTLHVRGWLSANTVVSPTQYLHRHSPLSWPLHTTRWWAFKTISDSIIMGQKIAWSSTRHWRQHSFTTNRSLHRHSRCKCITLNHGSSASTARPFLKWTTWMDAVRPLFTINLSKSNRKQN